ncbi:MAG: phosphatidylserine decarboxylase, partial [Bdellovibrionales bacterium]|nr:phosphatidylserine decarboxylase [Bdellovibrionales bacterium]
WHVAEGDRLERGERYGIIKLGSRMDHFLPANVEITVRPGDHVTAGVSELGVLS